MLVPFSQMWSLSEPDIDGFFSLAYFYKSVQILKLRYRNGAFILLVIWGKMHYIRL